MAITGKQLKDQFKINPKKVCHAFAATLRDFGYSNLTDEHVLSVTQKLMDGGDPGSDVIAMFINDWITNGID